MYSDFENADKIDNNRIFMSNIKTDRVLILDGPELRTANYLLENKYEGIIHVVEKDLGTVLMQKLQNKSENVKIHGGDVYDFLNKDNNFTAAYFDFTCTPRGCLATKTYPMSTVDLFLKNKKSDIHLAVTFSTRLKVKYSKKPMAEEILKNYLKPCFRFNQYEIAEKTVKTYRRHARGQSMAFFMFRLKKNKKINPLNVRFVVEKTKDGLRRFPGYSLK
jgi:hypothetical protein